VEQAAPERLVERLVEIMNTGDLDGLAELYAGDYVDHDPLPGQPPGFDGVRIGVRLLAQPDVQPRFHLEHCFAAGDRVAYRIFGSWMAAPQFVFEDTLGGRRTLHLSGVGIFRCHNGRFTERWGIWEIETDAP
jgi:hypothetical protein